MADFLNGDYDIFDLIKDQVGVNNPSSSKIEYKNDQISFKTGSDLLMREIDEIPCLVDPILPRSGVVALGGASDTGKSSILRQLAIDVCTGDTFLGFAINSRHKRAIYVSTEDDEMAVSYLLNKQNKDLLLHPDDFSELIFMFDTEDLVDKLDKMITDNPVDLVVIDCFTDIYSRSMNQANEVRTFLNQFSQLANKHQCLFTFLHHTGKNRENDLPSKNNLLGSQAFEAKMRAVFELRNDLGDDTKKHLCIVKGNYLPAEYKKESYVLNFSENLVFTNTGDRCVFDMLVKNDDTKKEQYEKIVSLKNAGYTYEQIAIELGLKSKGTITKILKRHESVSTFPGTNALETETENNRKVSKAFPVGTMETMETETKMEKQVMKDFKFTLEKYKGKSTRHTCPGCKLAQCFVRYIDEKGNYIDERVGRCNREDKCGYHLTPSEYFRNKGEYCTPTINVDPKPLPPTDYIPEEMMIKSLRTENNFVKFLAKYFPLPDVAYTIDKYRLGDAKEGKVIYWQIDKENRVRTGKMMLYDVETGHRVKGKPNAFDWVHRHVKNPFQLEQCLFGLHINEDKPIAIVESEKSAVIANLTIPKYTWMATGGKQNFRLMEAVKGLDVTLFPDLGAFEQWHQHASNFGFKISNLLELIATKEEKEKGLDISDFILKQM